MSFYTLRTTQLIPSTLEQVWDFISSPSNLKQITPEFMGFDILTPNLPDKMYPGMIISYQPPLGLLGAIANAMFIKGMLKKIFDYRTLKLEEKFGRM